MSRRHRAWTLMAAWCLMIALGSACSVRSDSQNSLKQNTGDAGSTMPRSLPAVLSQYVR